VSTKIREIRLLPPLAISRLGAALEPVNNYDVIVKENEPLGFRSIEARPTLIVDTATGRITARKTLPVTFKDDEGRVRPVAPFIELWGLVDKEWMHLTQAQLDDAGVASISWRAHVGNIKIHRRTGNDDDKIDADSGWFSDHARHQLEGKCKNFLPNKTVPLGHVQFIDPTTEFPHIRIRYTPAEGKVYGPVPNDPNYPQVYDPAKDWVGYTEDSNKQLPQWTIPGQIYYGAPPAGHPDSSLWISKGFLDDECDGTIEVALKIGRKTLNAVAHVGAGPPMYAPDSFPIRTVYDELEQALLGAEVEPGMYSDDELQSEAEEIIRRAFETVRLMNTAYMNGNAPIGATSTMSRQDNGDTNRTYEPIMAPTIVDNIAVRTLHQNVFTSLRSGAPPWFVSVIRRFDEIGDLTDLGRRKMPGMMRNADGRYLTLTRRQFEKIRLAASRLTSAGEKK
jgi:hypothetical protein